MQYEISQEIPTSQFIRIQLQIACQQDEPISLQLPAWRPGRYELAHYAQYVRRISVHVNGENVPFQKLTKDRWTFRAGKAGDYVVDYEFYAGQMDAGGCWADTEQLYVNFSNLAFDIQGRTEEEITISLRVPGHYQVATALTQTSPFEFWASNYQELIDSPFIASPTLKHATYQVANTLFHLWFQGDIHFDIPALIETFRAFTARQIDAFGDFPAENYHFLYQLLPYTHFHGVEHKFSTVITYGSAMLLQDPTEMAELVGVSSHELYHFWNVCRIRPAAILPYDLSKEAYLQEGLIAEGVTTYLGDMYLLRCGAYSMPQYLDELTKRINRETVSQGWKYQSIADSSFDLWLDGYKVGIPDKKVSIYNRGALISLCLDLILLDRQSSLEDVMKQMWNTYGKTETGYTLKDFESIVSACAGDIPFISAFFQRFIYGTEDLLPVLRECLMWAHIAIRPDNFPDNLGTYYGIILDDSDKITRLHPDAPAYHKLMRADLIGKIELTSNGLKLDVTRGGKSLSISLPKTNRTYFDNYELVCEEANNPLRDLWMR
ncbi:MAG: M61 family metallopeptidase [Lunatimonas sp.]|uniref:M61 family metallopeptidase n=1 Tax=Lunatimonas sp. TaxID=2060141 RepID=UPI00263B0328|nr:M61 family peptidase [Lunatimonas sp.]MCC5937241.1 M61 family metallopeptidase [Lunatimonas sp.]